MCGIITPILGVVASTLSVASGIQTSIAAKNQSQYQADMAERAAKAQAIEAEKIKKDVAKGETALRQEQSAKLGSQRSLLAAQGYALSDADGSAGSFLIQEEGRNEEEALRFREEGEYQVWRQENAVHEAQAKAQFADQKNTHTTTSSLLDGGKKVANSWYAYAKN